MTRVLRTSEAWAREKLSEDRIGQTTGRRAAEDFFLRTTGVLRTSGAWARKIKLTDDRIDRTSGVGQQKGFYGRSDTIGRPTHRNLSKPDSRSIIANDKERR